MKQLTAPRITLKLWNKGQVVLSTNFKHLRRFPHYLVRHPSWDKAYIKVLYLQFPGLENDVMNDGTYTTKKDLIKAYQDFTEASLVRDTYKKNWN